MLVNIVNNGQNPQRMSPPLSARSFIRLHRFDISPNVFSKTIESIGEFTVPLKIDWEDSAVITFDCESPSDIIEGSAKPMCNLGYQQAPTWGEFLDEIRVEDIEPILRVFLNDTMIRVTCDEGLNFSVEDIKVFLRPIDTSEGGSHWFHMISHCK